mmetsp:Transcript_50415/g.117038  ORF Transcript_50415/g.117038 Transcript_50415/m.117038 type:complete len:235 (+) Transcript_50415:1069-1773(+)
MAARLLGSRMLLASTVTSPDAALYTFRKVREIAKGCTREARLKFSPPMRIIGVPMIEPPLCAIASRRWRKYRNPQADSGVMPVPMPVVTSNLSGAKVAISESHRHSLLLYFSSRFGSNLPPSTSSYKFHVDESSKMPPPPRRTPLAMASNSFGLATEPGKSTPDGSRWMLTRELERPRAPAATASSVTLAIFSISSSVRGFFTWPSGRSDTLARAPKTHARMALCPTSMPTSQA